MLRERGQIYTGKYCVISPLNHNKNRSIDNNRKIYRAGSRMMVPGRQRELLFTMYDDSNCDDK